MPSSCALHYSSLAPLTATLLVAVMTTASAQEPLLIAKQGSIEAGGEIVHCATTDGGSINPTRQIPGKVRINHAYATYQYPANQTFKYPVLFNPGGGHAARVYDTTPDGREGWLTMFVRDGFAVYGVDRVNSGRSGSDVCAINAARLGVIPAAQMPTINRYSAEAAWVEFRWGPKYGTWYEDTQFPKEALETYLSQLIPNFRDPQELQKAVAALSALLEKTGPAILQSWSSGGLIIYKTAIARPDLVKGVLALENSATAFDEISDDEVKRIAKVAMINVIADRTPDRVEGARKFQKRMQAAGGHFTVDPLPEAGIRGNGHTMMLEKNNKVIMDRMVKWLRATVND